jgi:hypothetical protein
MTTKTTGINLRALGLPAKGRRGKGKPKPASKWTTLIDYCRSRGYPVPDAEVRVTPDRKFAFDFAWPDLMIALEVDGGLYGMGKPCPMCKQRKVAGHGSIQRKLTDIEKFNLAALQGWRVVHVTPDMVKKGTACDVIDAIFKGETE